jgi:tRNA G26 N,N-dimethylase Trm1
LREDGFLQPIYAVTNLYLAAEVERFTEPGEETGWRKITPAVIAQASEQGLTLDTILSFLQHYCAGGIPASLLIRLKLWGSGYSEQATISVVQPPLLYLSEQVLRDIQSDPAIQSLLGAVVPQQGRLVGVPAEHLAQVIEMLRERGFEVT